MHTSARTIAAGSLLIALILAAATLLVPTPAGVTSAVFRPLCIITGIMLVGHVSGALLFVLGMRSFSAKLKAAYGWLMVGFVLLAVSFVQLPLLSIFNWADSIWSRYGLIALPFIGSVASIYVGARGFARLFGVKSIFASARVATALAVACAALTVLLPNAVPNIDMTRSTIEISKFAVALPAFFVFWANILVYRARQQAGPLYVSATGWLAGYLLLDSLGSVAGLVARLVQPGNNFAFNAGYMYILYAVSGVVLLKAALEFVKISAGETSVLEVGEAVLGKPVVPSPTDTLVDIVVYTAALTANAHAVDPILDNLRSLTAVHDHTQPFDAAEQQRLAQTYLGLETYLAEQEPVRKVARDDLRRSVARRFKPLLAENPVFTKTVFGEASLS